MISLLLTALVLIAVPTLKCQPNAVGMSQPMPADVNTQTVVNQVLQSVIAAVGQVNQFTPISYRIQQTAGGANYFVKVYIQSQMLSPPQQYVHLRVGQSNAGFQLNGMELNRQATDPISYIFVKQCVGK